MLKSTRLVAWLFCFSLVLAGIKPLAASPGAVPAALPTTQVAVHPRLWLTPASLAVYRSWATDANPLYTDALLPTAEQAKLDMDAGLIAAGDLGSNAYEDYPTENYALLFAFMYLLHPDPAQQADYGQRARTLLLQVMTEAAKGAASGEPFRDPAFSINDRSRWYGVSFPLAVDWLYPLLTPEDKALIRTVFLRWQAELTVADTTTYNHPEPLGVYNDPVLLANVDAVRWSGNNYYTAHLRNMGMMALALDPADDPDGALGSYLEQATGAWLYVQDALLRTEAAGGLGTEGFEYSPQSLGYTAQLLLALHTAGVTDTARYGEQIRFDSNPFWDDTFPAYFNSLSPATVYNPDYDGEVYQPAWYGSGQDYLNPDFIQLFGVIGIYDDLTGNVDRLNAARWLQKHTPAGGAALFLDRSNDASEFYKLILYFLLYDPTAPEPTDPRPLVPTTWYAPGMRRLLARTDWTAQAAWLTYNLSWDRVDHQTAGGNGIEFYRQGEWLTKIRVGYDLDYLTSENLNTLTVQNDPVDRDDYRLMIQQRGSQWLYSANDPTPPVYSEGAGYLYVTGDATPLYNTAYEELSGVTHVSRAVVWLKPDTLVVYDRATTTAEPRPKTFVLNLPAAGVINANQMTMTTPGGQQFTVTSLLPAAATLTVSELADEASSPPAHYEIIRYRLVVDAGGAADTRFLHVLQGSDEPLTTAPTLTACPDHDVAVVGTIAVLFPRVVDGVTGQVATFTCALPAGLDQVVITGLAPAAGYEATLEAAADGTLLQVSAGGSLLTDAAGVLIR